MIGNKGGRTRSDCFIKLETSNNGKYEISIKSKVKALYGKDIENRVRKMLKYFRVESCKMMIEDSGALPFVLEARIEAAIKKLIETKKEYLPDILIENKKSTSKNRDRTTRLYLPGNTPSLMLNAGLHKPKGLILDLEDAVAPDKKYETRFLVRNALRSLNFYGAERMVRINQIPAGLKDLPFIVPHFVNLIIVPKAESANQIILLNNEIDKLKKLHSIENPIWLMPIIESTLGVIKSYEIASSASNIAAMAIGLEDYTADLGTKRTNEGTESFFARSAVVNACKAAGIQAIDSVFSDVADMVALRKASLKSRSIGFDGMGCIHPRQVRVIEKAFAPTKEEIERAEKIVAAFKDAKEKGLGVVSLGTKMIDPPVVKRALNIINKIKKTTK